MVKTTPPLPNPYYLPNYVILEDHWDEPNHKRVDVTIPISLWIEQQDVTQWKPDVNTASSYRYIITPKLLTLLLLKWS